jgi:hypothetical protein
MWSYNDWVNCSFCSSVNITCSRIMIGMSFSSVSKHNMWSYYDWGQRQPNHNTTTYCVYWRKTTTTQSLYDHILWLQTDDNNDNPIITRRHIVLGFRCCRPSVNRICGRIMIGLSFSSSLNTICGRIMIGLSLLSSVRKHNMWSYYDWVFVVFRL